MPDSCSYEEALAFSHWGMILQLLKLGLPWEVVNDLREKDIDIIMAIYAGNLQKQEEDNHAMQRRQR